MTVAENKSCDLIVMASHGRRTIGRLLLGSVANEVLTHCKVPALIVR
jgi:nucleotide-binding universal stress UspA family protein